MQMNILKNNRCRPCCVLAVCWMLLILMVSGCVPVPEEEPSVVSAFDRALEEAEVIVSVSDGFRQYAFDAASIHQWTDREGNEILDVRVIIEIPENVGIAYKEIQLWHIDYENRRYRISDSYSYDREGNLCET